MPKIQIVRPIPVNNSSANSLFLQGVNGLVSSVNPLKDAIKTASDNSTQRLTGLAQQYAYQNDPNDPDFQQGLNALRKRSALGQVNEEALATAIFNRNNQIPALQGKELANQSAAFNLGLDKQYRAAERETGLQIAQAQVEDYKRKAYESNLKYGQDSQESLYNNHMASIYSEIIGNPDLTSQQLANMVQGLPPEKISEVSKMYYDVRDNNLTNAEKQMELLGIDPSKSNTPTQEGVRVINNANGNNVIEEIAQQINEQSTPNNSTSINRKTLRNSIFKGESGKGEDGNWGNYNIANQRNNKGSYNARKDLNLSEMTIGQIRDLQRKGEIFAAGAYQIVSNTLQEAIDKDVVNPNDKFDKATQDKLYTDYLAGSKRPQIGKYIQGQGTIEAAAKALAQEWASIATSEGKSYYDGKGGNTSSISYQETLDILKQAKADYNKLISKGYDPESARKAALLGNTNEVEPSQGIPTKEAASWLIGQQAANPTIPRDIGSQIASQTPDRLATEEIIRQAAVPQGSSNLSNLLNLSNNNDNNLVEALFNTQRGMNVIAPKQENQSGSINASNVISEYDAINNIVAANRGSSPIIATNNEEQFNPVSSINSFLQEVRANPAQFNADEEARIEAGTMATHPSQLAPVQREQMEQKLQQAVVDPAAIPLPPEIINAPTLVQHNYRVRAAEARTQQNIAQLEAKSPEYGLLTGSAVSQNNILSPAEEPLFNEVLDKIGVSEQEFQSADPSEQEKFIGLTKEYAQQKEKIINDYIFKREKEVLPSDKFNEYLSDVHQNKYIQEEMGISKDTFTGDTAKGAEFARKVLRNVLGTNNISKAPDGSYVDAGGSGANKFTPKELGEIIERTGKLYAMEKEHYQNNNFDFFFLDGMDDEKLGALMTQAVEETVQRKRDEIEYQLDSWFTNKRNNLSNKAISNYIKGKS